jgi:hypothetical protein
MIVNHRLRFVFIAVPRTASVAMSNALMGLPGSITVPGDRHRNAVPPECRGYYTFACVRNPYAREWSHYCYLQRNRPPSQLKAIVKRLGFARYVCEHAGGGFLEWFDPPQSRFLEGLRLDAVLRFEELPGCFGQLPFVPEGHLLRRENGASRGDWRSRYGQEVAELVYRWAEADFTRYGYDRRSWRAR